VPAADRRVEDVEVSEENAPVRIVSSVQVFPLLSEMDGPDAPEMTATRIVAPAVLMAGVVPVLARLVEAINDTG
jgi:hypothetical protein